MLGVKCTYYITSIRYSKYADIDTLIKAKGDLILCIQDRTAFEYVIISASFSTEQAKQY